MVIFYMILLSVCAVILMIGLCIGSLVMRESNRAVLIYFGIMVFFALGWLIGMVGFWSGI